MSEYRRFESNTKIHVQIQGMYLVQVRKFEKEEKAVSAGRTKALVHQRNIKISNITTDDNNIIDQV